MKSFVVALLSTVLAAPVSAVAADSPLSGRCSLDVASLTLAQEARPKRVDLDFRSVAGGRWATRVEIVEASGNTLHSESTLSLDGTPGRASGTYWIDVLAAKMPAPDVLVMQFVYEGIPRSTRVYSVSADGKVLTETESYFRDGKPVLRTAFFKRVADTP